MPRHLPRPYPLGIDHLRAAAVRATLLALGAALLLIPTVSFGQTEPADELDLPAAASHASLARVHGEDKIDALKLLASRITKLEGQLNAADRADSGRRRRRSRRERERFDQLQLQLQRARASFQTLAAHVSVADLRNPPPPPTRDLLAELRELTAPVLDAFRRMSARPRKIEGLRSAIADLEDRAQRAGRAQIIVTQLAHDHVDGPLRQELARTSKDLHDLGQVLKLELNEQQHHLDNELAKQGSVLDSATSVVGEFLTTKGRNMLLSLVTFLVLALGLMTLRRRLFPIDRLQAGRFAWLQKPLSAAYGLVVFLTASSGALLCLYLLGDMLLFTLAILALSFVVWSTRQMLPHVVREVRLVLNLGPVREGERVVWRGLPWRVNKLGLRPLLENPLLEGGAVRLPAAMLLGDVSRPTAKTERWFPTERHDWVILADGTWGRVQSQTPERVVLAIAGEQQRAYPVEDFLSAQPANLSHGFLKQVVLPLPPAAQPELAAYCGRLEAALRGLFADELAGDVPAMRAVDVFVARPAPWALQVEVQLRCEGELAARYRQLEFTVARCHLALSSESGWTVATANVAAARHKLDQSAEF